jgi:hypothetical protein
MPTWGPVAANVLTAFLGVLAAWYAVRRQFKSQNRLKLIERAQTSVKEASTLASRGVQCVQLWRRSCRDDAKGESENLFEAHKLLASLQSCAVDIPPELHAPFAELCAAFQRFLGDSGLVASLWELNRANAELGAEGNPYERSHPDGVFLPMGEFMAAQEWWRRAAMAWSASLWADSDLFGKGRPSAVRVAAARPRAPESRLPEPSRHDARVTAARAREPG